VTAQTSEARLRVEQPAKLAGIGKYEPREKLVIERDSYKVPLTSKVTWIELSSQ
jgi:hypothetical protein